MCGPPIMNASVIKMLKDLGVEDENIMLDGSEASKIPDCYSMWLTRLGGHDQCVFCTGCGGLGGLFVKPEQQI